MMSQNVQQILHQNSTTVHDSPSVIKPISVCISSSYFINVLRDAVMACSFDTTGSADFCLSEAFSLLLLSTWSGFLLPVVEKKISNHRGAQGLIQLNLC
jgi:hypothetical protein